MTVYVVFSKEAMVQSMLYEKIIVPTLTHNQVRQTRPNSGGCMQRASQDSTKGGLQFFLLFTR